MRLVPELQRISWGINMATKRVTVLMCDNPACEIAHIDNKDEPAHGYHGKQVGIHLQYGGGSIKKWYACSLECIAPAIEHLWQEEWER